MVVGGRTMNTRCHFSDLPEDLQVLLFEIVGGAGGENLLNELGRHCFAVREIPMAAFPDVSAWTDYRDRKYAEAMAGHELPPAVICDNVWLDGRHRVWVWRKSGMKHVPCIDLAEIGLAYPFEPIAHLKSVA
jgi:hypothetical protein